MMCMRKDAVSAADMQAYILFRIDIITDLHEEHKYHHGMQLSQPGSTPCNCKFHCTQLNRTSVPAIALRLSWLCSFMSQCQAWEVKQGKSGGQVGCPKMKSLVQYPEPGWTSGGVPACPARPASCGSLLLSAVGSISCFSASSNHAQSRSGTPLRL